MIMQRLFFALLALGLMVSPAMAQQAAQGYSGYSGGSFQPTGPTIPKPQQPTTPQAQVPQQGQAPGMGQNYYPHVEQPQIPVTPPQPAQNITAPQVLPNAFDTATAAPATQQAGEQQPATTAGATPAEPAKPDPCAAYMQSYDIYVACKDRFQKIERMKEAQTRRNTVPEQPKAEEKKEEPKQENPNIKNQKGFIINKIKK